MELENFEEKIKQEITEGKEKEEKENMEKNLHLFKRYSYFLVVIFLVAGSFFLGYKKGQPNVSDNKNVPLEKAIIENKASQNEEVDFSLFWKVWDLVKEKHVERNSLDAQKMVYGAINGMLSATSDPYSSFFNPEESKMFSEDIAGSFDGIGAELGMKDKILTVIAPLDGSPAQKAGIRSGDKILKIDEKSSLELSIDQAVDLIRGKKGTQVKLTILHDGEQETVEINVIRDTIKLDSAKVEFKDDDIAYLKIIKFSDDVDVQFDSAMNKIIAQQSKGIILDLRDNPGGLLDKSIKVASRMIAKGSVVVLEENNAGKKNSLYTIGGDKLSSIPMVVLINEGSASASEILAGALKDDRGLTLIGEKTFGKGSVQQLMDLPGGSSVKITVAKWLTPKGDYIMEKGISPDIEVEMTNDDYKNERDPQLDKAMEIIKEKIHPVK
ncbi:MAG: Carboxyl-terminal protease [Candidatus Moranbacteria bacterium GW2011_GWF2_36_839]|nr:MAG: Carboxyl-terminal protease [Candidatus Moranbacteria bacterium GW2011_GWF1_36_78]KKQ17716.1 MAG: Carboxyl-terminal protease [Candidatus Moranbacteria bacterium GW2011_GWF2_36_839]HAT73418.1 peptidase S41 [Candidatus Moranbacteria bacterium]HBY10781.1 peptidase S41 [Candidatus Moranbacteria bacterium]